LKTFYNFAHSHFSDFFFVGGHFFFKVSLHFGNQHKILEFLYTEYDLFQAKNFPTFPRQKNPKKRNAKQQQKNAFSIPVLYCISFANQKLH
jgi:hypothetical protein